jgi:hypothetical protein
LQLPARYGCALSCSSVHSTLYCCLTHFCPLSHNALGLVAGPVGALKEFLTQVIPDGAVTTPLRHELTQKFARCPTCEGTGYTCGNTVAGEADFKEFRCYPSNGAIDVETGHGVRLRMSGLRNPISALSFLTDVDCLHCSCVETPELAVPTLRHGEQNHDLTVTCIKC